MNILIVEDESSLAGALEHILQKDGHVTDWAVTDSLHWILSGDFPMILFCWMSCFQNWTDLRW